MSDEKGVSSETQALFRQLPSDPTPQTSGRLAQQYANNGMLDATSLQRLLADYRDSLTRRVEKPRQSGAVLPVKETRAEAKAREEARAAEALKKWNQRFAGLVPFVQLTDGEDLARLYPTEIEAKDKPNDELRATSLADDLLKDHPEMTPEEQYTWDMCLVYTVGTDKELKFDRIDPPTEEELLANPKAGKKKTRIEMTEKAYCAQIIANNVDDLERAGLKLFMFLSIQKDEVYVLIGCDEKRLAREADRIEMDLKLAKDAMISHGKRVGLTLAEREDLPEETWENIYSNFRDFKALNDPRDDLYFRYNEGPFHPSTPFHHANRLKLIESIIKAEDILGGAGLQLRRQMRDSRNPLKGFYPLHHYSQKQALKKKLLSCRALWRPPTKDLVVYYGEQIALYFVFLSTYIRWLVPASIVGVAFAIYQIVEASWDDAALPAFGIFMICWSAGFLEGLKRKVAEFRVEFGMTRFMEQETVRAEFEGDWILSPISGKLEEVFPWWDAIKRKIISVSITIAYILLAISAIVGIFALRAALAAAALPLTAVTSIASAVNSVQIQVFNQVYSRLSVKLNDFENHRTDSQYENALIIKAFFFKVLNSFVTFIYIGFWKRFDSSVRYCKGSWMMTSLALPNTPGADDRSIAQAWVTENATGVDVAALNQSDTALINAANLFNAQGPDYRGDCFGELSYQLFIVFGLMITVNNAIEILGPYVGKILQDRKQTKEEKKDDKKLTESDAKQDVETPQDEGVINAKVATVTDPSKQSDAENEFEFQQYEGTFADYDELILQYGFVVLFVVVFPAAPFFALLNNFIEFPLDSEKILGFMRRPHPQGAFDMGTWFFLLELLSWLMVVSNTALITFSSHYFITKLDGDGTTPENLWIAFVVVEHILIGFKVLIAFLVPDVPAEVEDHLARQQVIDHTLVDPTY